MVERFGAAEECDFLRNARIQERWLGAYKSVEESGIELDRVAIFGRGKSAWFVVQMIVDREGHAHAMLGRREFPSAAAARKVLAGAR